MGWPARLILIRHGKSEVNVRNRDENARLDTADNAFRLVDKGRRQSELTRDFINSEYPRVDTVMSSSHDRATETAEIIFPDREILVEPRLAEMRIGMWTMFTEADIAAILPREIDRFRAEGLYHYKPFGGENGPDVELRIHSLLTTLRHDYEGATVALVTHHQWLVLFQRVIDGVSIAETERRMVDGHFANASVTVYGPAIVSGRPWLLPKMVNHVPWSGQV